MIASFEPQRKEERVGFAPWDWANGQTMTSRLLLAKGGG